jgi:hypothetical protein
MTTQYTRNFALAMPDFRTGPWHDLVNGDFYKIDQLLYGAYSLTSALPWQNSTLYPGGSNAVDTINYSTWISLVAHTSAAVPTTFAQDRTAHPTYWKQVLSGFVPRGEWQHNTHYFPYDLAYQTTQGIFALCTIEHVSNSAGTILNDSANWSFLVDFHNIGLSTAMAVSYSNVNSPRFTAVNVQQALDQTEDMITALDAVNVNQGNSITALQNKDIVHETRMTAIENKDIAQDASIAGMVNVYVARTGDYMSGPLQITSNSEAYLRLNRGTKTIWILNNSTDFYLIPGETAGDTLGPLRPLAINLTTGVVTLGQNTYVNGDVNVSGSLYSSLFQCWGNVTVNGMLNTQAITAQGYLSVINYISSNTGYRTKHGQTGGFSSEYFNFEWTGSALQPWAGDTMTGIVCDPRVKRDVHLLDVNALELVSKVKTVTFRYKDVSIFRDDGKRHIGFIADNLEKVFPEAVIGATTAKNANGDIQPANLDLTPLVSLLMKAVQELTKRVEELESAPRVSHTKKEPRK